VIGFDFELQSLVNNLTANECDAPLVAVFPRTLQQSIDSIARRVATSRP